MRLSRAGILLALPFFMFASKPMQANPGQQTPALGLIAKSAQGHIGNAAASEGDSVYSGDQLVTDDHGSMLVRIGPLSLDLQENTEVHVYRAPYGAVVELKKGTVLYTTPGNSQNLVIVASDVRVTPLISAADLGSVTIDDPCNVTVHTQQGQANVQVGSENRTVEQGKAYRVRAENEISYRKYLSPDADDYHDHHEHTPCAPVEMVHGHPPIAPGQSHFLLVSAALIGAGTGVAVYKTLESPARP
jgi:hypothetical protein